MKITFKIILVSLGILSITACATNTSTYKTSSASISQARSNLIIDNESTRTDVLSIFGSPNGFTPSFSTAASTTYTSDSLTGPDYLMFYKDCEVGGSGQSLGQISASSQAIETCSVFTAILDESDIVTYHVFIEDNLVTADKISLINQDTSNLRDVVQILGGPASILESGNSIIYSYANCVRTQSVRKTGFFSLSSQINTDTDCQEASVVFDKQFVVQKANFIPFSKASSTEE